MLKQMRSGAQSTILKTLLFGMLLMAMAGLALMDVQGMFRNGPGANVVASIDGQKISTAEFDRMVQQTLRARQISQANAYQAGLPQQILRDEIDMRMIARAAHDAGIVANDVLAAKQIKEMIRPLTGKGVSEKEALSRLLQAYGMSEGQLVWTLKSQIATQQLYAAMTAGAYAPQREVEDLVKYKNEWRRGEYFTLTSADASKIKPAMEADLKAYYDSVANEYALPEYRELGVLILDKKILGDNARPSEEKLRQVYEDNIDDYKTAETRTVSQIVAHSKEDAEKIYAALQKGGDVRSAQTVVEKSKSEYIKPGSFTADTLPDELSKPAFAVKEKTAVAPVETPLGWHILYVEKISPSITRSFASVRAEIEHDILQDKASEALYNAANKIDDDVAGGKTLAEVAKEYNLSVLKTGRIDVHGVLADGGKKNDSAIPLYNKVVETGFNLQKDESSPLIETPTGAFLIVNAQDVIASEQRPFEKVKGEIAVRWQAKHKLEFLATRASEITARLKKGDGFNAIAKDMGKPVQTLGLIKRGESEKSNALANALFSIPQVGEAVSVSADNAVTIVRLAERQVKSAADKKEQAAVSDIVAKSTHQDVLDQYRHALMKKYNVKVNEQLVTDMYAPKEETY